MLLLDSLGKRYGYLPSEVYTRATTLDVYVFDMTLSYEEHIRQKVEKKHNINRDRHFEPKQDLDDLAEKMKQYRERKNG